VAGSIGGAGRLNFSVIGDAVNVAARVEAATRTTGDDLLVTGQTRDAMTRPMEMASRGEVELKGKAEPVEVLAPAPARSPVRPEGTFTRAFTD
jgi:class 3 adenylate cyclase